MNDCKFKGNLTADPELRRTPSGTAVVSFRIATNRRWKNQQGEQVEETTFLNMEAWDGKAEAIAQYLRKGDPILIARSHAKNESWEDKESGQKRHRDKYIIDEFEFVGARRDRDRDGSADDQAEDTPSTPAPKASGRAPARGNGRRRSDPDPVPVSSGGEEIDEDSIPF